MHDQHPAPGGQPARPEGNRPANNARLSTPSSLGAGPFPDNEEAGDFLGLGEEFGAPASTSAGALFQPAPAQPQPAPQQDAWEQVADGEELLEEVVALDDEGEETEAYDEQAYDDQAYDDQGLDEPPYAEENDEEYEPPPGVLAAWKEAEPRRRGNRKLILTCVGVAIVGMTSVAVLKLVTASGQVGDVVPEPLAAHSNPLPSADRLQSPGVPAQGAVEPARLALDEQGRATPTETRAGFEPPALDPAAQARAAFESARGDQPPAGFDPVLDTAPAPAALTDAPAYDLLPPELQPDDIGEAYVEPVEAQEPLELASSQPAPEPVVEPSMPEEANPEVVATPTQESVVELVAQALPPSAEPTDPPRAEPPVELTAEPAEPVAEPVAAVVEPAPVEPAPVELAPADPSSRTWLDLAALRGQAPPAGTAPGGPPPGGPVQPAAAPREAPGAAVAAVAGPGTTPEAGPAEPDQVTVEGFLSGRDPRPVAVVKTSTPTPAPPSGNLRQASRSDLATVWQSTDMPPREELDRTARILTPNVGRVRVLLHSKDVFEGRLYAVGEGNAWIETQHGRMALQGTRIASMEQLVSAEGTPVLGDTGSQDLAGLQRVRVKTPGGVFYGKVIARDEKETTLVTDDGARLTLDSKMVELLVDVPRVTIKGTAPEKKGAKKP